MLSDYNPPTQDGAWACALIVIRPNVDPAAVAATTRFAGTSPALSGADGKRVMDAWLGGIWYDSGEAYANAAASAYHCSPIGKLRATTKADTGYLPISANTWPIDAEGGAGSTATDRILTRNL